MPAEPKREAGACEVERMAMLSAPGTDNGRAAQYAIMGILNRYRAAVRKLLARRWADGALDGACVSEFSSDVDDIERDAMEWKP